ncbi:MAG: hypothetical protein AB8F26_04845 [Phycisphaerales bacterium]
MIFAALLSLNVCLSGGTTEVFYDDTFVMNRFHVIYQDPPVFTDPDHTWTAARLVGPYYGSVNERLLQTYLTVGPTNTTGTVVLRRNGWTIRGDEQSATDTISLSADLLNGSDLVYSWLTIGLIQGSNLFVPDPLTGPVYLRHSSGVPWTVAWVSTGDIEFSDFYCFNNPGAVLDFGPGSKIIKLGLFHHVDTGASSSRAIIAQFDSVEFVVTTNP